MKVTDLINELNLNKVDQLLAVKVKGAGWTVSWGFSGGFFSGFEWDAGSEWGFTWTDGDNSTGGGYF